VAQLQGSMFGMGGMSDPFARTFESVGGECGLLWRNSEKGRSVRNRTRLTMAIINKEPERHEIEALLPWYVAGTLSRRDADRVEQALAGDRELVRRYDLIRQELAETIHLNEMLGAPSARAMEKLFAAIKAESAPRRRQRIGPTPSLVMASGSRPKCAETSVTPTTSVQSRDLDECQPM
jgi:hypothetical protein